MKMEDFQNQKQSSKDKVFPESLGLQAGMGNKAHTLGFLPKTSNLFSVFAKYIFVCYISLYIYHLFAHRVEVKQMNLWCVGKQSQENGGCMCTSKTCFQGWFSLGKLEMGFIWPSAEFWDEAVSCLLISSHLQKQTAGTHLSAPAKPSMVHGSTCWWLQSLRDSGSLSWPFCWPRRGAAQKLAQGADSAKT